MPMLDTPAELKRLFTQTRTIAVVGVSSNPSRPSHYVSVYMRQQGYTIIPVNPAYQTVLGVTCYPSLLDIPEPVDMVDVFRRPEFVTEIVEDAIKIGAHALWLQLGVIAPEAAQQASDAGLDVVMDRCLKIEHPKLFPT